ncbi:hypothetical protein MHAE_04365 [Mycobacterium haemophilum DSM 44634]
MHRCTSTQPAGQPFRPVLGHLLIKSHQHKLVASHLSFTDSSQPQPLRRWLLVADFLSEPIKSVGGPELDCVAA